MDDLDSSSNSSFDTAKSSSSKENGSKKFNYVFISWVKQERYENSNNQNNESALYGVQINPYLQKNKQYVFATVGKDRASIYECEDDGQIILKQTYTDGHDNLYCCCWSILTQGKVAVDHILLVGGHLGVIRVISITRMGNIKMLRGHGSSINDLKIHPKDPNLLLSISKDHSLRLWNIRTETCIAIFGGIEGHRDECLSADFHLSGKRIISCGMDHAFKIWNLDSDIIRDAINRSETFSPHHNRKSFKTLREPFPIFQTRKIHRNYVDSVCWFGNLLLSKSCENAIVLWKVGKLELADDVDDISKSKYTNDQAATIINKLDCSDNEIWFIRLTTDMRQRFLATGNRCGVVFVWKFDEEDPTMTKYLKDFLI